MRVRLFSTAVRRVSHCPKSTNNRLASYLVGYDIHSKLSNSTKEAEGKVYTFLEKEFRLSYDEFKAYEAQEKTLHSVFYEHLTKTMELADNLVSLNSDPTSFEKDIKDKLVDVYLRFVDDDLKMNDMLRIGPREEYEFKKKLLFVVATLEKAMRIDPDNDTAERALLEVKFTNFNLLREIIQKSN